MAIENQPISTFNIELANGRASHVEPLLIYGRIDHVQINDGPKDIASGINR